MSSSHHSVCDEPRILARERVLARHDEQRVAELRRGGRDDGLAATARHAGQPQRLALGDHRRQRAAHAIEHGATAIARGDRAQLGGVAGGLDRDDRLRAHARRRTGDQVVDHARR